MWKPRSETVQRIFSPVSSLETKPKTIPSRTSQINIVPHCECCFSFLCPFQLCETSIVNKKRYVQAGYVILFMSWVCGGKLNKTTPLQHMTNLVEEVFLLIFCWHLYQTYLIIAGAIKTHQQSLFWSTEDSRKSQRTRTTRKIPPTEFCISSLRCWSGSGSIEEVMEGSLTTSSTLVGWFLLWWAEADWQGTPGNANVGTELSVEVVASLAWSLVKSTSSNDYNHFGKDGLCTNCVLNLYCF